MSNDKFGGIIPTKTVFDALCPDYIRQLVEEGYNDREVAELLSIKHWQVYEFRKKHGIEACLTAQIGRKKKHHLEQDSYPKRLVCFEKTAQIFGSRSYQDQERIEAI